MLVYVFGGQGFIGSAFCRYLKSKNIKYISLNRKNYKNFFNTKCDIFINCNGNSVKWLSEKNYKDDFHKNVISTYNTLKNYNFKKYILISSGEVYNKNLKIKKEISKIYLNNLSNYGLNKIISEQIVTRICNNYLIFRMGGFVGSGLKKNIIYDLVNKKKIWSSPQSIFQFIDVDMVPPIIFKIMKKSKNDIFNLTGDKGLKVKKIINLLEAEVKFANKIRIEKNHLNLEKIKKIVKIPSTQQVLLSYYDSIKNPN